MGVLIALMTAAVGWPSGAVATTTTRISVDTEGLDPDGDSFSPSVDAKGRFVAFSSFASDLVSGDTSWMDVFVRDLATSTTTRVSVSATGGSTSSGDSDRPSIDAKGRFVAFESTANDLVAGDSGGSDVFVRDLKEAITTRVSVDIEGEDADGNSYAPSIDASGRFVAFESTATNLVAGDDNARRDIFVRDLKAATTMRVSVDASGGDANSYSFRPSIAGNGRFVAFDSNASDLIEGDGNDATDIFVRDLKTATTTRVSVNTSGGDSNGGALYPSIDAKGRFVAFESPATNLVVANDGNVNSDIFVRDMKTATTRRVSVESSGGGVRQRQPFRIDRRQGPLRGLRARE